VSYAAGLIAGPAAYFAAYVVDDTSGIAWYVRLGSIIGPLAMALCVLGLVTFAGTQSPCPLSTRRVWFQAAVVIVLGSIPWALRPALSIPLHGTTANLALWPGLAVPYAIVAAFVGPFPRTPKYR
jgi:Na+/melibiose symporter-like transporter